MPLIDKFFFAFLALMVIQCSDRIADPSNGSETTNGLCLVVLNSNSQNARSAKVYVHPQHYLADTNSDTSSVHSVIDSTGRLQISDLADSSVVEIVSDQKESIQLLYVKSQSRPDTIRLQKSSALYGNIDLGGLSRATVYIQVEGLRHWTRADSLGNFSLAGLPPGKHLLRLASNVSGNGQIIDTLITQSSEIQNAGTFRLGANAWKDTLIVRKLLDSNGLSNIPLSQVIQLNRDNRIVGLDLDSLGLRFLSPEISTLRLRHLSLNVNLLDSLPSAIGQIRTLEVLSVRKNNLVYVPGNLGDLSYLRSLDLSRNLLSSLPENLVRLQHLQELQVGYNSLLQLPAPQSTWVDTYSTDTLGGSWRATQK